MRAPKPITFAVSLIVALFAALNPPAIGGGLGQGGRAPASLFLGHICGQAPTPDREPGPVPHHDCLLCPTCLAPATQAALTPAPPAMAAPRAFVLARIVAIARPRAPPGEIPQAAYARGPPTLL